jgi:hypothetical protein
MPRRKAPPPTENLPISTSERVLKANGGKSLYTEFGSTGLQRWGNQVREEYLPELRAGPSEGWHEIEGVTHWMSLQAPTTPKDVAWGRKILKRMAQELGRK